MIGKFPPKDHAALPDVRTAAYRAAGTAARLEDERRFRQLVEPVNPIARHIDACACTGNGPASIESLETIHHPCAIFGATTPPIYGRRYDRSCCQTLTGRFPRIAHHDFRDMWHSRSYNQAADVPRSKLTCKLPRSPWINSRMVAASISRMDSITTLPLEFRKATEIVA
jgi:hypothetical protein